MTYSTLITLQDQMFFVRMMHLASALAWLLVPAVAQAPGDLQAEKHPPLTWSRCHSPGECEQVAGEVTMDQNWRWIHGKDNFRNCYDMNIWVEECEYGNSTVCTEACVIEGVGDYERSYGVNASGDSLTLDYVTRVDFSKNVGKPISESDFSNPCDPSSNYRLRLHLGSRLYLMAETTRYEMFTLMDHELAFDVDLSSLECGVNGALHFLKMDEDGGASRYPANSAGAEYGAGYCGSACSQDLRFVAGKVP